MKTASKRRKGKVIVYRPEEDVRKSLSFGRKALNTLHNVRTHRKRRKAHKYLMSSVYPRGKKWEEQKEMYRKKGVKKGLLRSRKKGNLQLVGMNPKLHYRPGLVKRKVIGGSFWNS